MFPDPRPPPPTLMYDGDCVLCLVTARWLASRVSQNRLRLLALQSAPQDPWLGRVVAGLDQDELTATLRFVTSGGEVQTGARAVLAVGRLVPRWRYLATVFDHRIGHAMLEPIYRLVASNRHLIGRAFRLSRVCPAPLESASRVGK